MGGGGEGGEIGRREEKDRDELGRNRGEGKLGDKNQQSREKVVSSC